MKSSLVNWIVLQIKSSSRARSPNGLALINKFNGVTHGLSFSFPRDPSPTSPRGERERSLWSLFIIPSIDRLSTWVFYSEGEWRQRCWLLTPEIVQRVQFSLCCGVATRLNRRVAWSPLNSHLRVPGLHPELELLSIKSFSCLRYVWCFLHGSLVSPNLPKTCPHLLGSCSRCSYGLLFLFFLTS